eukprot:TRINITY_DN8596_c0_g1_i3.p1 TRINITY_DN8596_c0_g1~~TRINITY_DN8596_c0_g1_i3.p1  ORF type:complete len:161 (-),score=14.37 TRINITY_DN8596_c0_g1_i3:209-691(-)
MFMQDLVTHGPLKPEEVRGLTTPETIDPALQYYISENNNMKPGPGQRFNEDKSGYRTGVIIAEETANIILDEIGKAQKAISKSLVDLKVKTSILDLKQVIDGLRGAMMIGYPAFHGLPEWEPAREILENRFDFTSRINENIDVRKTNRHFFSIIITSSVS